MTIIQCHKCGARQNEGTHCAVCGALLNVSPHKPSTQYNTPQEGTENFGKSTPNANETQLSPAKAPLGVVIKERHAILLITMLLMTCIGVSVVLSFVLNQKPKTQQIVKTVQSEPVVPTVKPEPRVEQQSIIREELYEEQNSLKHQDEETKEWTITHDMILKAVQNEVQLYFNEEDINNPQYIDTVISELISEMDGLSRIRILINYILSYLFDHTS